MATTHLEPSTSPDAVRNPSVLAVLVARDAAGWLRACLQSLANQTYGRLGVVAVDNASTDGTSQLLSQALGDRRVIDLADNRGLAGAVHAALELPAAAAADYVLILHDDVALAPDAVARMVDAAEGIQSVERVGVVGPKVVDWDDPRLLRDVGRSTDRFGHPYTPLQEDELDQGQFDRVLEVLSVSSCAMLVSREAWRRTGAFDERYAGHHDDLDFCWRARLAGFRVLMTPLAVARHRSSTARGVRPEPHRRRSSRYYAERAGLASMLKDYGLVTLLWLLPVYAVLGAARLAYLAVARRFEDAYDLLAAWGWNLLHLPGTIRRRVRAQSVRAVRDRAVLPFMAPTFRLPRWFERAEEFLEEGFEEVGEVEEGRPLPRRAAAVASGHPVLVASVIGIALGALAVRHFVGPDSIDGAVLASFPDPGVAFGELFSAVRSTALGGAQAASPALAAVGGATWLSFSSPELAEKLVLSALLPLATILAYRSFARQSGRPGSAVVAAAAYALSALGLWAFSEGRIPLLVALAVLPVVWDRTDSAFGSRPPDRPFRLGVGLGVAIAVAASFEPGFLLAVALVVAVHLLAGRHRGRGFALVLVATAAAAALAFPVVADVVSDPAPVLSSVVGSSDPWSILRLSPGAAPGSWALAGFLPVAALLCFAAVETDRGRAWRAMSVAVVATVLAWASATGRLPDAIANAPVYLATAAFAEAAVVAYAASGLVSGLEHRAFGLRQIGAAMLTVVLGVGLGAQAVQVTLAEWGVHPNGLPPAWPVVDASGSGEFRILWLGSTRGERFPAPGGDPVAVVDAGAASVRFGLTDRRGTTALDVGRADFGAGYDALVRTLDEILVGDTSHGGALLGPFGIRYVVADEDDLPAGAVARLQAQIDLDQVPAGGLTIFRNAAELPPAFVASDPGWVPATETGDAASIAVRPVVGVTRIRPPPSGAAQPVEGGELVIADQLATAWRVDDAGERLAPRLAFGWAMAAEVEPGDVSFVYTDQWVRRLELGVLAALWLAALWITRKPGSA